MDLLRSEAGSRHEQVVEIDRDEALAWKVLESDAWGTAEEAAEGRRDIAAFSPLK
jgi:hypothetical protein